MFLYPSITNIFQLLLFFIFFSSMPLYPRSHFWNYDLKHFELGYLSYKVIILFIFNYFQPILMAVVTQFSKSKEFN